MVDERTRTDRDGHPLPPWDYAPDRPRDNFAWHLGFSADHLEAFEIWFRGLTADEQTAYTWKHPEPAGWRGYYGELSDDGTTL